MIKQKFMSFLLSSLILANPVFSFADSYKCIVTNAYDLTESGALSQSGFPTIYIGREFVVDRDTGIMVGGLSNINDYGTPVVNHRGSKDTSFKVLTLYSPYSYVDYLEVIEFEKKPLKPFSFHSLSNIFTGLCSNI